MRSPTSTRAFDEVGRIPAPGDNVAIATRRLEAGTVIAHGEREWALSHTVLEGHRFALQAISVGERLLSWGLPFGRAIRELAPGDYVCNEKIIEDLAERDIDFPLPEQANFRDHMQVYEFQASSFRPGEQVARVAVPATFTGYRRAGARGVGTRNFIVVLATTSDAAAFAESVAARFADVADTHRNIDGVVAVTHTEGGGGQRPNNLDFVLRTLAGFMLHANVGAVLVVDYATGSFDNNSLRDFMASGEYAVDDVTHAFMDLVADRETELERAVGIVRGWLPEVDSCERTTESVANLRLALQCGGSDAFSGISGNPLAGWVAKEVIRNGGSANLAETDELIGAEPYVLENVRDETTARRFLDKIAEFKARAANHGTTAEGNPSGGNNYRGLYNIALKSIGAARKRDPQVRLDYVIDYAEPMTADGYYFMDSPGNDLESIAGQVASGANVILFITGNGSITNFPFVPTLKFVTTSGRFALLADEMDVNAGRYNDGESLEDLGAETFELSLRIASGECSKGELAGHSQVAIWRDWPQNDGHLLEAIRSAPAPDGEPLNVVPAEPAASGAGPRTGAGVNLRFEAYVTRRGHACDRVGLVMPTSLCSGQVARLVAEDLNARKLRGVSRFVALAHTEGCCTVNAENLYLRTLLGHIEHPCVRHAMLLEHGCEKVHNDAVRHYLDSRGIDSSHLGFASVQMDGGLEKVRHKIGEWFARELGEDHELATETVGAEALRLGLTTVGPVPETVSLALARLVQGLVAAGATVVIAENASVLADSTFTDALFEGGKWTASLAYGQPSAAAGCHVMEAPTENAAEALTGLGGTGVEIMLAHVARAPLQSHPMIPLIQLASDAEICEHFGADLDLTISTEAAVGSVEESVLSCIAETASRHYVPKLFGQGHNQFQLTRGLLGLSL
jgi:altronate dehydratase